MSLVEKNLIFGEKINFNVLNMSLKNHEKTISRLLFWTSRILEGHK